MTRSPYELTTPEDVLARLHPRLRTYFGPVPAGYVGLGEGVFAVVGTPRRWLWPLLACFARDAVMFPVWERDVPFTVENRPARVGRRSPTGGREGNIAVRAHRTFRFRAGTRTMVDAITAGPEGLVDHLGRRGRVGARLHAEVDSHGPDAGALRLVSTHVSFRALGRDLRLPARIAPRVIRARRLARRAPRNAGALPLSGARVERFDDDADVQRVSLVLTAPLLGTLYRYEGSFRYRIVPDTGRGRR